MPMTAGVGSAYGLEPAELLVVDLASGVVERDGEALFRVLAARQLEHAVHHHRLADRAQVELPATVTFEGIPADLALPAKKAADDGAIGYPLALPVAASFDEADAAACGYALVAPIAVGGTLTLSVATSEGGTRDVPLTLPAAGFGAGKAYDVVLKFTSTQIMPQATISPWEEAGDRIEVIL